MTPFLPPPIPLSRFLFFTSHFSSSTFRVFEFEIDIISYFLGCCEGEARVQWQMWTRFRDSEHFSWFVVNQLSRFHVWFRCSHGFYPGTFSSICCVSLLILLQLLNLCFLFIVFQLDIFELIGVPLVENCLAGFNSSIFAYGQVYFHFRLWAGCCFLIINFQFLSM
jgi:hypothetical protein